MPEIWGLSSGTYCLASVVIPWERERRDLWGSQSPNYLELYRVKSTSSNHNFKQMGRQFRLWKIGITHSLWLVPLSCWAAEFSLCLSFWVVSKAGTTLREIKPCSSKHIFSSNFTIIWMSAMYNWREKLKNWSQKTKYWKFQASVLVHFCFH